MNERRFGETPPSREENMASYRSLALEHHLGAQTHIPIAGVPEELLSQIFVAALKSCAPGYETTLLPIIISHTCAFWRQTALSTAELWTHIMITEPLNADSSSRIGVWLDRSRERPLDILLDVRDPTWNFDESQHRFSSRHMGETLERLLPHLHRWKSAEILSDIWAPIHTFLSLTQSLSAPMLRSLSLNRANAYYMYEEQSFAPTRLRSPVPLFSGGLQSLLKLNLVGVHVDWDAFHFPHVTELAFKYHALDVMPSAEQFTRILLGCSHLSTLSILPWGPRIGVHGPGVIRIPLPFVTRFDLGFLNVNYAVSLLAMLSFPHLKELSIQDVGAGPRGIHRAPEMQDASPILNALSRLSTSSSAATSNNKCITLAVIQSLTIDSLRASPESMFRFLSECSDLRCLSLTRTDDTALRSLHPAGNSGGTTETRLLCPRLRELTIASHSLVHDSLSLIVDMIVARGEACARAGLESLTVATIVLDNDTDIPPGAYVAAARVGTQLRIAVPSEDSGSSYAGHSQPESVGVSGDNDSTILTDSEPS